MKPLELVQQPTSFSRPDWIFEIKHDGFRSLAYIENGRCRLTSREGVVYSRFKDLIQAISDEVDAEEAVLDGEIVALDAEESQGSTTSWGAA
jgi:bifunctional non-homologous end joining protein LigD